MIDALTGDVRGKSRQSANGLGKKILYSNGIRILKSAARICLSVSVKARNNSN